MDKKTLVKELRWLKNLFQKIEKEGIFIQSALLVWNPFEQHPKLILASFAIEKIGPRKIYESLQKILTEEGNSPFVLEDIYVISPKHPFITTTKAFFSHQKTKEDFLADLPFENDFGEKSYVVRL